MLLITKEILKNAPKIGTTSEMKAKDVKIVAKFFHPLSQWKWYMTEYDAETKEAFGFVKGDYPELGYFSLDELESLEIMGLGMERDRHFEATLEEVMNESKS